MATTTCPNCGKPLRPGARFCGSCGATISTLSADSNANLLSDPDLQACPRCGKPVRTGAKFCSRCGFDLTKQPTGAEPSQTGKDLADTVVPQAVDAFSSTESLQKRTTQAEPTASAPPRRKRRLVWTFVLLGLVIVCALTAAGGFLYFQDPFGIIRTHTPVVAGVLEETIMPASPQPTEILNSPTPESVLPTATETVFVTAPIITTPAVTLTLSVTATPVISETQSLLSESPDEVIVLIEDEFSESLATHWRAWGNPLPTLRKGFGDSWLDLKAVEEPGGAGVTSRVEIENSPGVRIAFDAQLNPGYPQFPLLLDWDPLQFDRGPANTTPTIVHFELRRSTVSLQAPAANNNCQVDLDGTVQHTFLIQFSEEKLVSLYIDDSPQPLCQLDMGIIPVPGKLSFTGNGWVTRILVTSLPAPE